MKKKTNKIKTQGKSARELGISRGYLNAILNKKKTPSVILAKKISVQMKIPFFKLRPDLKKMFMDIL